VANAASSSKGNTGHTSAQTPGHTAAHSPANTGSTLDKAKDAAANVADKARDAASSAMDKAKEATSTAYQSAGQALSDLGQRAESATTSLGGSMQHLAGTIRESAPHEGMLGTASSRVADSLESGGRYLQEEGLSGLAEDVTTLIRRNPIPAVLVGVGLGFLLARTTSRR
jgi:F0F1-type ATP synthase assembly protein I